MKFDNMILGENAIFSTDSVKTGLNNNCIVVGGTGSGKTMSIIEPRFLYNENSNMVVTVTKRRIIKEYRGMLESRGYDVSEINFAHPEDSDVGFDPLDYVTNYNEIRFLAEAIVTQNKDLRINNDPYWYEASISLLCAEIGLVLLLKDDPSFADVLELHDHLTTTRDGSEYGKELRDIFSTIHAIYPGHFIDINWSSFANLPEKTSACVMSTLDTTINTLFTPELRKFMKNKRSVNFNDLATKKTVIFVTTSPVNPALHSFVNLFYSQLFKDLFEIGEEYPNGQLPIPISVICDDFATGGKILNFPEYISIFREKRISVQLLVQSESQLDRIYGRDDAITIINNCDTYVFLGGNDYETAHQVSRRLDKPLEEVLYMPIGRLFIFRRGQKPIETRRYPILEDERYKESHDDRDIFLY